MDEYKIVIDAVSDEEMTVGDFNKKSEKYSENLYQFQSVTMKDCY